MPDEKRETIFEGMTSFAQALQVRDVMITSEEGQSDTGVLITIQDAGGVSTFMFKKQDAGQFALNILGRLAKLGDKHLEGILNKNFPTKRPPSAPPAG